MKNIIIIFCAVFVLFGCTQSKEKKAKIFAEQEVVKILNNADSYEPVETKVDSAFTNIYIDTDACVAANELLKLDKERGIFRVELQSAKSDAAIYSDFYDAYSKEEYRQAKMELQSVRKKITQLNTEIENQKSIIKARNEEIENGTFCGWCIIHSFRCTNGLGVKQLHVIMLIADKNFKKMLLYIMLDDGEEGIKQIQEVIDNVLE